MATLVGEESEQQQMENEAKAKEEADAAARGLLPPPPPFLTQQDFAQYMRTGMRGKECSLKAKQR
jgi:hypothetical protein